MFIKNMKIVLITPNYAPEQGACAERVRNLAEFLHNKGHEILVITALPNYPKGKIFDTYRNRFHKTEIINHITVLRYWLFASHSKNLFFRLLAMLSLAITVLFALPKIMKFKPNFVYVQSPPLFLVISGYLIAKICKAKFWLNLSDLWSNVLLDLGVISNSWVYKMIQKIEHFLYQKADLVSGQSQEIVENVKNIRSIKNVKNIATQLDNYQQLQVFLCRTGVDCNMFQPYLSIGSKPLDRYSHNKPYKIRFVYAGLLGIAQGVLEFCEQVSLPENVELHIYGDGAERNSIAKYIANHAEKQLFLHHSLPQIELARVLPTFDAALILQRKSIFGTIPSKLYEAMACGLPIMYVGNGEGEKLMQEFNLCKTFSQLSQVHDGMKLFVFLIQYRQEYCDEKRKNARLAAEMYFDRYKILEDFYSKIIIFESATDID